MPKFLDEATLTPEAAKELQAALAQPDLDVTEKGLLARAALDATAEAVAEDPNSAMGSPADPFAVLAGDEERARHLWSFKPRVGGPRVEAVRPHVVSIVARIAFLSVVSDRSMMSICYAFALWCHRTFGNVFNPVDHMSEEIFQRYLREALHGLDRSSQAAHVSALRRFARGGRVVPGIRRKPATGPHSQKEVDFFQDAVEHLPDEYRDAMTMLLHLTFGCGLRSSEIQRAQVEWVDAQGSRAWLVVPDHNFMFREVPVLGQARVFLKDWVANRPPGQYLLRPDYKHRRNTVTQLIANVAARDEEFAKFKAVRARHTWLLNLLRQPIPFTTVCAIAGIGTDSNLPTDLMPYFNTNDRHANHHALTRALDITKEN